MQIEAPELLCDLRRWRLLAAASRIFARAPYLSAICFGVPELESRLPRGYYARVKQLDLMGRTSYSAAEVELDDLHAVEPASDIFDIEPWSNRIIRTWSLHKD